MSCSWVEKEGGSLWGGGLGGADAPACYRWREKQKESCTTIQKSQKQKISSAQDVGSCCIITGTRFPYYICLRYFDCTKNYCYHGPMVPVIYWYNQTKKWVRNWKSEEWVSTVRISTSTPALHNSAYSWRRPTQGSRRPVLEGRVQLILFIRPVD
jgi:hypothetical protein